MVDYSAYSIYDTNILIYAYLNEMFEDIFNVKQSLFIADKVRDELRNIYSESEQYKDCLSIIKDSRINVISERIFSEEQQKQMIASLVQFGMQNFFERRAREKNEGEFASALYAVNLNISSFYTNDLAFIRDYANEEAFKSLTLITFKALLDEIYDSKSIDTIYNDIMKKANVMESKLKNEHFEREEIKRQQLMNDFMTRFNITNDYYNSLPEN